jgi:hypothetical protein
MDSVEKSLLRLLDSLPVSALGISEVSADIKKSPFVKDSAPYFARAITLLQAYAYPMEIYNPLDFHSFLVNKIKPALDASAGRINLFLQENGVACHTVTNMREDPVGLIGEYSQKRAAVRAGLGWIGKNTLLVHPQFGPRVRISTILTSLELEISPGTDMTCPSGKSGCGDCAVCVKSCPSQCLKGAGWKPGIERSDLIDINLCRERNDALPGCICGVCLLACPFGIEKSGFGGRVIKR